MKPFQLNKAQLRNLAAAQDDMDCIDLELEKAKASGIPIDPSIIEDCELCRDRLAKLQKNYVDNAGKVKVIPDERISKG